MWYSNRYRRHLLDMHIDEWDDSFLSRFSPEEYVNNLIRAKINNAMLYFQSHVGLCYYPTKIGKMHRAFQGRENLMRDLVDLCHANDIKVTGYYSLNYNTYEHDRNPDWRMLCPNGLSFREDGGAGVSELAFASNQQRRYGQCCPNQAEYREFTYRQIDEMLEYFDMDAIFFDMPFWQYTCYCPACRTRWEEEFGGEMPVQPAPGTEDWLRLAQAKYKWMGEWIRSVTDYVKLRRPDMPVEHNYACGIAGDSMNGCGEEVGEASDYAGGDLYGGMLEHSFTCKFYINATRNQPFEYMFSRCKPALRMHTLTKTLDEMKTSVAVTAAHHGATLVIDAIDPVGTMDRRVYDRFGEMFAFEEKYEPYFRGKMVEDIGIYYGIRSKFNQFGEPYDSKLTSVTAAETLMKRHIPFGVTGNFHTLSGYRALIAPVLSGLEVGDNDRIAEYVENGGVLYLSGGGNAALVERLTGGRITGDTETDRVYIASKPCVSDIFDWFNADYPMPFEGHAALIEGIADENVLATLTLPYTKKGELRFASIHSDPPGVRTDMPMIVSCPFGKGRVIWSAVPLEGVAMDEYRDVFMGLLMREMEDKSFSVSTDAPEEVELTLFRGEGECLLSAVHLSNASRAKTLSGFEIAVEAPSAQRVTLLPGGEEVPFAYEDGRVRFHARDLTIFDMYRIEL